MSGSARDRILERVRQATSRSQQIAELPPFAQWHESGEAHDRGALLTRFTETLAQLKGTCHCVPDLASAGDVVARLLRRFREPKVLLSDRPFVREVLGDTFQFPPAAQVRRANRSLRDLREVADFDIGVTDAEALVADTGSVLLYVRAYGARCVSHLLPVHVALAHANQLVVDLPAAIARMGAQRRGGRLPTNMVLVTGCSRTSDIEKILVMPAQGPKELHVVVVE